MRNCVWANLKLLRKFYTKKVKMYILHHNTVLINNDRIWYDLIKPYYLNEWVLIFYRIFVIKVLVCIWLTHLRPADYMYLCPCFRAVDVGTWGKWGPPVWISCTWSRMEVLFATVVFYNPSSWQSSQVVLKFLLKQVKYICFNKSWPKEELQIELSVAVQHIAGHIKCFSYDTLTICVRVTHTEYCYVPNAIVVKTDMCVDWPLLQCTFCR